MTTEDPTSDDAQLTSLLVCALGETRCAFMGDAVERILPMVELAALPEARPDVVGVLNMRGTLLPVVDPRPRLGAPPAAPGLDQRLVLLCAGAAQPEARFVVWVDRVEQLTRVPRAALDTVLGERQAAGLVERVARLADSTVPVLSPAALYPGAVLRPAEVVAPD